MKNTIATVALDVPLTQHFDFSWPPDWPAATQADIHALVAVPFGKNLVVGIIMAIGHQTDVPAEKLRALHSIRRDIPPITGDVLALIRFCESYYHAPFGQIAINVMPPLLRKPDYHIRARKKLADATSHDIAAAPTLNAEQQHAVTAITNAHGQYAAFLLEGITGSGKTEVYLQAIAATLARGEQALVLVPEINLTPQFLRHVMARFPNHRVISAHSGLAAVARLNAWRDAQDGVADIVVGTRLSIFTPMPRLGLIVVDEEHDQSFKQQEGVRYSARDVAVFRASHVKCPIVLGSATPSIETLDNVSRERFSHLRLTKRAVTNAALPTINFIHLDSEKAPDGLTDTLIRAIDETIKRGEQAMVFINRRGYAPALVCGSCAWMPECKRCSARMVFHRAIKKLKCHHCGAQSRAPTVCGDCGSTDLHPAGQGSERIEDALRQALPSARIARVDRDATRRKGSAEKIFDDAAKGDIDILVGTQMLAKGHDFPKLTLVGVVNADGAVFSADFRAAERMAQQIMQVAGRAGRAALPGRVLIQTRFVEHPVYQAVATHHYAQFVDAALSERRLMHLPPYSYLALLRAEARDETKLDQFLDTAQQHAIALAKNTGVRVWEPVASTLARKASYTRKQLMVQSDKRGALQHFLSQWLATVRSLEGRSVKWVIDVDPIEV
jgi:primosomal protein N' (replication factor Y) (superfamily II helicase)